MTERMKREPGENPGHYPMLLAPQRASLLPVATVQKNGKAAKRWSKSEDLPLLLLIAAFGTKGTGEIKVGIACFFLSLNFFPIAAFRVVF